MTLPFLTPDSAADVRTTDHGLWVECELVSVNGNPKRLHFLKGKVPGAWCVPMNGKAQVRVNVGSGVLDAVAYRHTGIAGAKVAIAWPGEKQKLALKEIVAASDLWMNHYGGPWAMGHEPNRLSYLLSTPDRVTLENVGQWIEICQAANIRWLDWVHCFRWGDYEPWPESYPNGWADVQRCVGRLQEAGIASILHTYSAFILRGAKLEYINDAKEYRHGFLPTSEWLLEEVAGKIAQAVNLGPFDGVYFDALDWCNDIEEGFGWHWVPKFLNGVGRGLDRPDTIVETSMSGTSSWNCVSRWVSQDQGDRPIREYADKLLADCRDCPKPWTLGWFLAGPADSDDDIRYVLRLAGANNAGMSWRELCPSKWGDPRVREIARLIAGRDEG